MRLLSVNLARSLWFCHITDFNPKGLNLVPIITPLLVSSYKFTKYPSEKDIHDLSNGISYENGEFLNDDGNAVIIRMTLYSDGLIADTISSTNDSDAFITEMLTKLSKDLNLPHYNQVIKKRAYLSQLHISTDKSLELINPKLKEISDYLSNNVLGGGIHFEVAGISFWADQTSIMKPSPFTFERVLNVPFSENRYYSAAALQTDKHLELLDKLESILS